MALEISSYVAVKIIPAVSSSKKFSFFKTYLANSKQSVVVVSKRKNETVHVTWPHCIAKIFSK